MLQRKLLFCLKFFLSRFDLHCTSVSKPVRHGSVYQYAREFCMKNYCAIFFFPGLTLEKVLSTLISKVGSTEGALTFCQHSHSFALLQATFLTLPSHVHVHFTVTTVLASIYCIFGYATSKEAYGQGWVYD